MRVAFLVYDEAAGFTGPLVNIRRLLPELRRRGVDAEAWVFSRCRDASDGVVGTLGAHGVPVHFVYLRHNPFIEDQVEWIFEMLAERQPHVFVANSYVSGFIAARWARDSGMATVAGHRSDDDYNWGVVDSFVRGEPDWTLSGLFCVSEELAAPIRNDPNVDSLVTVIPSGVPVPDQPSAKHESMKLLYIGMMNRYRKRVDLVAEALIKTVGEQPDMRAAFVGRGKDESYVRYRVSQSGLGESIKLLGAVPPEALGQVFQDACLSVLFSEREGTPGALMDAMAHGVVPIVTRIPGGVGELVVDNENGIVIEDPMQELTEAVSRMRNQQVWKKLSDNGRELIRHRYSLGHAGDCWEQLLCDLVQRSGPKLRFKKPTQFDFPVLPEPLARNLLHRSMRNRIRVFCVNLAKRWMTIK